MIVVYLLYPSSRCLHIPLSNTEDPHLRTTFTSTCIVFILPVVLLKFLFHVILKSFVFNISKNLAQADRRSWMTTGTTDTSALGSFHSPRHAGGCAVRPGGHVGWLPAVRVWRSARARGYGGSPGWRRSRWGTTRDRACRRSWGSPAVWSGAGGWRSGGGENIFSYVHVS